ncbi:phage holin family protein [Chroococcidiopsis sp. FACHB-1243]|uniref:phage holin family protein n=1 Tax=Chroococcidiopsis sp. [FACHB-1243] TaxID=2692781 RepID=UPI00177E1653|nr:phage holin family protein [Chroococcidiopsis sp. [FACHB-1243]]MBD2307233.1 phage holin family protein [Chroococcidiopsis sp. [FACHB-1243]]
MLGILITWLVTTVSFLIIARLPLGVEVDSFGKAAISAAVFGVLNALLRPILGFFTFPLILLTLGLFLFVLNAIIFGLAAALVTGFRLRWGIWSALLGSIALSLINSLLFNLLAALRL